MARSVFLSFLGTGDYKKCVYADENRHSKKVTLVQHALVELFGSHWTHAYIFTTKAAHKKHWKRMVNKKKWPMPISINNVKIPDGTNEAEMWKIFHTIFGKLEPEDEVYFDITHSFRSLPLLAGSLLQYAKSLENITA